MAVLNVLGYMDPNTGLYACYCYDLNIVGTGDNRNSALTALEESLDDFFRTQFFPRGVNIALRRDIRSMHGMLLSHGMSNPALARKSSLGHELHLYHFKSRFVHDFVGETLKEQDREIAKYNELIEE